MKKLIIDYLPYILSAITIYTMLLAGSKKRYTWLIGILNQFLWLIWIVTIKSWGLLPMNIALWIVYYRNHIKWQNKTKNK